MKSNFPNYFNSAGTFSVIP